MSVEYKFEFILGDDVLKNQQFLNEMKKIAYEYDFLKEKQPLSYLDESSIIGLMKKNDKLIAFSWIAMCKEKKIAELCWFVADKQHAIGLESKLLLDKTIEYCKEQNINSLKFNCDPESWGNIKNKNKLLSKYGYKLDENDNDYDISISI